MSSTYSAQPPEARSPSDRIRSGRLDDAELLAPPEVDPVLLSRDMFAQPAPRPPPAPLTNLHLKKVARLDSSAATTADGAGGPGGASGHSGGGKHSGSGSGGLPASVHSERVARSVAASSVRGGKAAFTEVSDEEVIDVDGEPTTLADDDLDLPASPGGDADDEQGGGYGEQTHGRGSPHGGLGTSGIAGLGDEYGGGVDPLEELEADTPAVRLAEATADLDAESQGGKDPWVMVQIAQMVLGQAKVVWRTMPVAVKEEPLLLAKAHFSLARAYQALGCDRQASDHGKQALAAIPRDVADTEAARALRTEVQVMRAEALLSSAAVAGITSEAACNQARKALALLVKAAGLQEPVAWTDQEVEDNELGGIQRATISNVTDMGIVALMAQCHGVVAEMRLRGAEAAEGERKSSVRSAEEAAARMDRRTDRGDPFYSPEQMDKYRLQEQHFRDEVDNHQSEVVRLAGEAERAYDAAMYCLNHVIDREGGRLEEALGREGKQAHPTFQALWRRSVDFMSGIGTTYALQRKDFDRLCIIDEILSAYAQYGSSWLPAARHIQALKDKGAMLVDKRDYDGATTCYELLTEVVSELFENDSVRKELQVAEVLKLRGDVALGAGDFRTAQHMFNQALEFYQRHLGVQAPVAQDLLHRIDEVKSYLADTRVMGRLASFPGRASQTVTASVMSAASTPKSSSTAARSGVPRPPPLSGSGSHRASVVGTPSSSVHGGGGRASNDGDAPWAGTPAMSTASASQRPPPLSASGSHRASSFMGTPNSRMSGAGGAGAGGAGGSARPSLDGLGGGGGDAPWTPASRRSGGGEMSNPGSGWGAPSPSQSILSHRSADYGVAAAASPAALSHRSGGGDLNGGPSLAAVGSPSLTALSHRSIDPTGGFGAGSPAALSHRSGDLGGFATGLSHRSGEIGSDHGSLAGSASLARRIAADDEHGAGGAADDDEFGGGGGGGGWPGSRSPSVAAQAQRLAASNDAYGLTGAASPAASLSHRSGELGAGGAWGGAASPAALSQRSGEFGGGGGGSFGGAVPPPPLSARSGEFGGGAASPAAMSQRSGEFGAGGAGFGGAGTASQRGSEFGAGGGFGGAAPPPPLSARSGEFGGAAAGFGGAASPAAMSQRSGAGPYGGAASPAAMSQRSGEFGGGGAAFGGAGNTSQRGSEFGGNGGFGGVAPPPPLSARSGEFGGGAAAFGGAGTASQRGSEFGAGGGFGGAAPPPPLSARSGEFGGGGAAFGGAASPAAMSQRSGAGPYGGAASPAAMSQRSGAGPYGGAASPAAMSQRSGEFGNAAGGVATSQAGSLRRDNSGGLGNSGDIGGGPGAGSPHSIAGSARSNNSMTRRKSQDRMEQ